MRKSIRVVFIGMALACALCLMALSACSSTSSNNNLNGGQDSGTGGDASGDVDADGDGDAGNDAAIDGGDADGDTDGDGDADAGKDASADAAGDAGSDSGPPGVVHCSSDGDCPATFICPKLFGTQEIDSICYRDCSADANVCAADETCMTSNGDADAGIPAKSICLKAGKIAVNGFKACQDIASAATSCNGNSVKIVFGDINQTMTLGVAQLQPTSAPTMDMFMFMNITSYFTFALTTEDALVVDNALIDSATQLLSAQMMQIKDPLGAKKTFVWGMSSAAKLKILKRTTAGLVKMTTGNFACDLVQYWAEINAGAKGLRPLQIRVLPLESTL